MNGEGVLIGRGTFTPALVWWRRVNVVLAVGLFLIHLPRFALMAYPLRPLMDFSAFYIGGATLNSERPVLYDDEISAQVVADKGITTATTPYIYPPFLAVLMRPLAWLPYDTARVVWTLFSGLCLAASAHLLLRVMGCASRWPTFLLLALALLVFPPVTFHLFVFGQINLLLLWLLLLAYLYGWRPSSPRHEVIAAVALGLATGIKLFPAVFIPLFWLYGRRRVAYGALLVIVLTGVVGMMGGGWSNTVNYLRHVLPEVTENNSLFWVNYALTAAVQRMFTDYTYVIQFFFMTTPVTAAFTSLPGGLELGGRLGLIGRVVLAAAAGITLLVDWWRWRKGGTAGDSLAPAFGLATLLLVMPFSWASTNVLLLFPLALLYRHSRSLSRAAFEGYLSFLILFFALIFVHSAWPVLGFLGDGPLITLPFWLLALSTVGMLLLWLLLLVRTWQEATELWHNRLSLLTPNVK